jgi:hypothetical protein
MKQIALTVVFTLVFGLAALAQTQSSDQQGSSSPSSSQSSTSPLTSQSPDMSSQSGKQGSSTEAKGEKKLKGCIESQGGQYVLREKNGKEVALTGSADFAPHVGHTVTLHGTPEKGGSMGSSSGNTSSQTSSSGMGSSASSSGEQFMVSKIDHVSDTCKFEKGSKNSKGEGAGSSMTGSTSSKPDHQ